jgi:hypothetical protein
VRGVPDGLADGQAAPVHPRAGFRPCAFAHSFFFSEIDSQDTPQLVRLRSDRPASTSYMCFDEAYFKTLENMQWNRDNGCIELGPISVGLP